MLRTYLLAATALVASQGAAAAWPVSIELVNPAVQRTPPVYTAAFAPDGMSFATSFAFIDSPGEVTFRDLATGKERFVCKGHADAVNAMIYSADGKRLASGDWLGGIKVWDAATGKQLAAFRHGPRQVWSLAFSPNGRMLASGSPTRIMLWELTTGKQRAVLEIAGEESATFGQHAGCSLAFAPDSRTVVFAAEDGTVRRWDVLTGKELAPLAGHAKAVVSATFAPDGATLATASRDGTVRLWNLGTGRPKAVFAAHKGPVMSLVYSPDGRMLASWCVWRQEVDDGKGSKGAITFGSEVKIWEVATGKERITFVPEETLVGWSRPVYPLRFTVEGTHLLTLGLDQRSVTDWDLIKLALKPK